MSDEDEKFFERVFGHADDDPHRTRILIGGMEAKVIIEKYGELNWENYLKFHGIKG